VWPPKLRLAVVDDVDRASMMVVCEGRARMAFGRSAAAATAEALADVWIRELDGCDEAGEDVHRVNVAGAALLLGGRLLLLFIVLFIREANERVEAVRALFIGAVHFLIDDLGATLLKVETKARDEWTKQREP